MTGFIAEAPALDPREEHFRFPSAQGDLSLFLRYMPPNASAAAGDVVDVHGGTFPSALSVAHRFDGRSWRDELCAAGFHVWGLDFPGFGLADPYPEMSEPAPAHAPLGRAAECSRHLETAIRFICERRRVLRVSLIAHSWGTIVAGDLAGRCPEFVDRLVFFGPIARREPRGGRQRLPAWRLISLKDQWERFVADVPADAAPVLSREHFDEWGEAYLGADPASRTRSPAAVKVPSGAFQDIYDAWAGELAYDPARVRAPVHRHRRALAVRRVFRVAAAARRQDRPRDAPDAPRGKPRCALLRDRMLPQGGAGVVPLGIVGGVGHPVAIRRDPGIVDRLVLAGLPAEASPIGVGVLAGRHRAEDDDHMAVGIGRILLGPLEPGDHQLPVHRGLRRGRAIGKRRPGAAAADRIDDVIRGRPQGDADRGCHRDSEPAAIGPVRRQTGDACRAHRLVGHCARSLQP
jgi:alpha-beta hydrolase superfamily lysophospholipase